jgi:hypothetical protein
MDKKEIMETIAANMMFVADKYYTAKEKMFGSITLEGRADGCSIK